MTKIYSILAFLIATLLVSISSNAQVVWQKIYGSPSNFEYPAGLVENASEYVVGGQWGTGSNDIFFLKTDLNGVMSPGTINRWALASSDFTYAFKKTTGGYVLIGNSFIGADRIPYIMTLNNSGSTVWTRRYSRASGGTNSYGSDGQQTADGGYVYISQPNTCVNFHIVKTNSTGNISWQREYQSIAIACWNAWSIQQTTDGGYIVGANTSQWGAGSNDLMLIKLDNASPAAIQWIKTYGRTSNDASYGYSTVKQTTDGGYVIVNSTTGYGSPTYQPPQYLDPGCFCPPTFTAASCITPCIVSGCSCNATPVGMNDMMVVKTDANGDVLNNATSWIKTYRTSDHDYATGVIQTSDGGYAVVGHNSAEVSPDANVMLLKIASDGTWQWSKEYGSTVGPWEMGREVIQTSDGGYLVGATGSGNSNIYLIKVDANGNCASCNTVNHTSTGGVATAVNVEVTNGNTNAPLFPSTVTTVNFAPATAQVAPNPLFVDAALAFTLTTVAPTLTTICPPTSALPIQLLTFTASKQYHSNLLQFSIPSLSNYAHLTLERSPDASVFEPIANYNPNPNANEPISFSYTDHSPLPNQTHYRIKITYPSGELAYSQTLTVETDAVPFLIYPNPAHNQVTIQWDKGINELGSVSMYDGLGKLVYKDVTMKGLHTIDVSKFSKGIYAIKLGINGKEFVNRVVVE